MSGSERQQKTSADIASALVELMEMAVEVDNIDGLQDLLPYISKVLNSRPITMCLSDPRFLAPRFFQYGMDSQAAVNMEKLCEAQFENVSNQSDSRPLSVSLESIMGEKNKILLYPLFHKQVFVGQLGLLIGGDKAPVMPEQWDKILRLLAGTLNRLAENQKQEKQITYLNTYLTVSSMLAQSIDLHELMEIALNCAMDIVSAEAASVLLLDDDKTSFNFYEVEGPAKPVLMTTTIPADKGLAASVLEKNKSEVINDVQNDPRFYREIDSASGFKTRNMIAIPLVAGDEHIGVLEVLNKMGEDSFTEEECLLLFSIAEEIAFAIRNAKVFEYVVDTYCKQRQGLGSCKGCSRPLGSWTPCAKQRDAGM
jgi:putative methionine-R-sulfoxide reductase with GAF domain